MRSGTDLPVGQDDDVVAAAHLGRCLPASARFAQALERALHAFRALLGRVGDVERLGVEAVLEMTDAADLLEILVGQDRLAHLETLRRSVPSRSRMFGRGPMKGHEGSSRAPRGSGPIGGFGHLREVLLEEV